MAYDLGNIVTVGQLKKLAERIKYDSLEAPTFSLSRDSVTITVTNTDTVTFTTNSDGAVTLISSDDSIAAAAESNGTITINALSEGAATITLKIASTETYRGIIATIEVTVSAKQVPTITLSSNSKEVSEGSSDTVTYTTDSDGAASVETSDSSIATANVSNGTITINGIAEGSATITLNLASTSTYTAASAVISVTVVERTDLESFSWAEIAAIGAQGTGDNYWDVGDTKSLTLNGTVGTLALSNYACKVYIIDFNYKGTNGVYFQGFKDANGIDIALCDSKCGNTSTDGTKYFNMNHWGNYNYGGWKGCDLRYDILGSVNQAPSGYGAAKTTSCVGYDTTSAAKTSPVANTLMAALPAALRTELEPWTVYSDNKGGHSSSSQGVASDVTTSVDYLPLLSEFEVQGARSYANQYEQNQQAQMAYYANGNSKIKYKHNDTATPCWWWLRSARYYNYFYFCTTNLDGSAGNGNAYYSLGLAPAFRVA